MLHIFTLGRLLTTNMVFRSIQASFFSKATLKVRLGSQMLLLLNVMTTLTAQKSVHISKLTICLWEEEFTSASIHLPKFRHLCNLCLNASKFNQASASISKQNDVNLQALMIKVSRMCCLNLGSVQNIYKISLKFLNFVKCLEQNISNCASKNGTVQK